MSGLSFGALETDGMAVQYCDSQPSRMVAYCIGHHAMPIKPYCDACGRAGIFQMGILLSAIHCMAVIESSCVTVLLSNGTILYAA